MFFSCNSSSIPDNVCRAVRPSVCVNELHVMNAMSCFVRDNIGSIVNINDVIDEVDNVDDVDDIDNVNNVYNVDKVDDIDNVGNMDMTT